MLDIKAVRKEAEERVRKEAHEKAVAAEVERLKTHRPWWTKLCPIRIRVTVTKI